VHLLADDYDGHRNATSLSRGQHSAGFGGVTARAGEVGSPRGVIAADARLFARGAH
jgi:hypothetical protein